MGLSSKGSGRGLQENPGDKELVQQLTSEEHWGRGQRQLHRQLRAAQSARPRRAQRQRWPPRPLASLRASSAWPHTIENPAGGRCYRRAARGG